MRFSFVIAVLAALLWSAPALAAPVCGERDKFLRLLEQQHTEKRVAQGFDSYGSLIEVFATETGSTWTIVVTRPGGQTCIVGFGRDWVMPTSSTGEKA